MPEADLTEETSLLLRPPTFARTGMVVASHPAAAAAGRDALRQGGSAVDALVAAGAVLAVVEPGASGLGGDAFFLVHEPGRDVVAVNGSGAAPASLTRDRFGGASTVPVRGMLSATTPGCVAAWSEATQRFGRLAWADLFAAAIRESEGFPVSMQLARGLRMHRAMLQSDAGLGELFLRDGEPLASGSVCRPRSLGESLRAIASEGPGALYGGSVGRALCAGVGQLGGVLAEADLGAHATLVRTAISIEARHALRGVSVAPAAGAMLHEQPLPSQGIVLLLEIGIIDALESAQAAKHPWEEMHRQIEAKRLAFALRDALLTDPAFLPVDESELTAALLDPVLHRALAARIGVKALPDDAVASAALSAFEEGAGREILAKYVAAGYRPRGAVRSGPDTTYLCAADAKGQVAGLIQSVFYPFGCGVLEPETGILLNNRAVGFSLDPQHINRLEPGKRTLHTLNSYLITVDGEARFVGGTPGGDNQVQTNLQILRHLAVGGCAWPGPAPMTPNKWSQARMPREVTSASRGAAMARALESPRWRHDPDGAVRIEGRIPAEIRRRVARIGHRCERIGPWEGSGFVQVIAVTRDRETDRVLIGTTDPRGEGAALGL